ncbi:NADH dehydrogenase subunit 4L (mitochondrion) [Liolophura japonica]|uniref:NADH dehydrogenase subunit 4L n=1 Tax=Liolophura japonica TaxID=13599 RepID=UPI0023D8C906|nr:NADH dehydrogenase subunit 4L [Liolophura japonica]WDQ44253.1 NADH dehydrogenase subunit 4L [Liolophura japonica]
MMSLFNSIFSVGVVMSILSLMVFCLQRKHLLNSLLALEMMMLSIFLVVLASSANISSEGIMVFVMLTLAASEAALGLSLLVILIRSHGNDYVSSLSMHKC